MTDAAIAIKGLVVRRGGHDVVRIPALEVPAGSVTGLMGPSGCGKTTLMRSIVGVQRIAAGRVTVLGGPAGSPALRPRVGYMTQAPSVYADLSAGENLRFFARVLGVGEPEIERALGIVGMSAEHDRMVGEMSGGQRTRVSLATALLASPKLLVLDEPTVGLDPVLVDELWDTFRELVDAGTTILISSHVMDEAGRCHSLMLMREGELLATETPTELCERMGVAEVGDAFVKLIHQQEGAS